MSDQIDQQITTAQEKLAKLKKKILKLRQAQSELDRLIPELEEFEVLAKEKLMEMRKGA